MPNPMMINQSSLAYKHEVIMKTKLSTALVITSLTFGSMSAHATTDTTNADVEHILGELSRQQDNASNLVKAAREPVSLSTNNALISKEVATSNDKKDVLGKLTNVASNTVSKFKQTGLASWYGRQFHGKKTASGETFDMNALTAAHPSLPLNCYVKVTNKANGKSVVVRINDRGPFHGNRVMDLSYGAAKAIGITQSGTGNVTIERVEKP